MKKYVLLLIVTLFLGGCNNANSMEDVFHKEMKSLEDVDDYSLIKKVEEDNIILFTSYIQEDEENNNHIKIGHFKKTDSGWVWDKTANCNGKWSGTLENMPYLWCGTLTEPRHEKVYVGDTEAKMIEVDGGVKRVWYHLNENENEEIKVVFTDGSEEWLKEVIK
ncbi:hypothetical protein [Sutcliffiella horikoshii]|uniref:hypothetical protein n=1 Tax=Sutcliffiella horikoshii TaxID=79883 RepID=UPI003CFBB812